MLVTLEEFWTLNVIFGSIVLCVDDIIVAVVVKDCVAMLVVLEKLWTDNVLVCCVVLPVENNCEGVPEPEEELWTVGVVTCVNLFVEEIGGVAENFLEIVAVLVDMLVLVEEVKLVDVVVSGVVVTPGKKDDEGVPVEIVVGVMETLLPVGELWTVGVVTCANLVVEDIKGLAEYIVEVVAVLVDMILLVEEMRLNGTVG